RVRIYPAQLSEPKQTSPQFDAMPALPGTGNRRDWLGYFAGAFRTKNEKGEKA
ncbi:MAG: hypothetical protein HYZ31_04060, partial [Gammaproteobacteria bacterium]|nr:hypothetical protein [Gammaproteobacteria bacterium]